MAERVTATASVLSSLGLALLGTTCCALPITLVALGAGGAVASLASGAPWLIVLSQYKAWTFATTGVVLGYAWWRLRRATECGLEDVRRLRWQRGVLVGSTGLLAVSAFAAYGLLPLVQRFG